MLPPTFGATHDIDPLGFLFGPMNVGLARMLTALEAHEPDQVARIAQQVDPSVSPSQVNRSLYWMHLGGAPAQLRERHDDAVRALRSIRIVMALDPSGADRDQAILAAEAKANRSLIRSAMGTLENTKFVCVEKHGDRGDNTRLTDLGRTLTGDATSLQ